MKNTDKNFLSILKDKNGKQIRDGSILLLPNMFGDNKESKWQVFWNEAKPESYWAIKQLDIEPNFKDAYTGLVYKTARESTIID